MSKLLACTRRNVVFFQLSFHAILGCRTSVQRGEVLCGVYVLEGCIVGRARKDE